MLHIINSRTIAVGVSALGLAVAGISVAVLGNGPGHDTIGAGASAARTAAAAATASDARLPGTIRTTLDVEAAEASFARPAPATRGPDHPAARATSRTGAHPTNRSPRPTPVTPTMPNGPSLATVDVGGPVNAHVDAGGVLTTVRGTVGSTLRLATGAVTWTTSTVRSTVRSLPVTARVRTGRDGTTAAASAAGVSLSAHVG